MRKPLETYLAPRSRHAFAAGGALLGLILAFACVVLLSWRQYRSTNRLEEQLMQLQSAQVLHAASPPTRQQIDEDKQWAQVKLEKDFPWERVFRAIERTSSPDIELLEFHPDKLNHVIILRGEARSLDGLLAYLQSLTAKTGWTEVHLTHQEKVPHGALETVSFEVKANIGTMLN